MHFRAFLIFLICVLLLGAPTGSVRADENALQLVERPDSEYLILGVEVNGYERSEGIDAYLPEGASYDDILIPLGALGDVLSVSIDVDPALGEASGFFISENRSFRIDLRNRQAIFSGKQEEISHNDIEPQATDIFVKLFKLKEWFGLDASFQTSSLTLVVNSDKEFPFEARAARQKKAQRLLTKSVKGDFDATKAYLLPYDMISKPSFTIQNSLSGVKTEDDRTLQSLFNLQAGFDFLGFGSDLNFAYAKDNKGQSDITNARLTFSRSDPTQQMLGPVRAGRIDVGDIDFPSVSLFQGSKRGAGIAVSSEADFGFRLSQQLGTVTIDGDAPVGWDAELYRNGQFINFQTIETDARFDFQNIELINGFNRFQIILFGPEGQEKSITRDIFSGPNLLPEGVLKYNFAAGRPEADFLPLRENYRADRRFGFGGGGNYGINNFLTIGGGLYKGPNDEDEDTVGGVNVAASYLGFNAQLQGFTANNDRKGWQSALRKRFAGLNLAFTHTEFTGFDEDDQSLKKTTEISASRAFGKTNVTLIAEKQRMIEGEDRTIIQNILSSEIFGIRFTNDIEKTISDNEQVDDLEGEISLFTEINDTRVRSALTYDLDKDAVDTFKTLRLSAQKKLPSQNVIRFGGVYDFTSEIASFDARYSFNLDPVSLDVELGGNTDQTYFAGVTMRTSLQADTKGYKLLPPKIGTLPSVNVRAFIDENNNGIYDTNEKPVDDVTFLSTRSEAEATTNEDGYATLYGLAATPTRVYVDQAQIESIYIQPARKGIDLIPRRGAGNAVDYPFTVLGEIDGFLVSTIDDTPLENVPVRLINVETGEEVESMQSEYDGYFVFSALPLGTYKIMASYGWFEEGQPDTVVREINLTSEDSLVLDQYLRLPPEILLAEPLAGEEVEIYGNNESLHEKLDHLERSMKAIKSHWGNKF